MLKVLLAYSVSSFFFGLFGVSWEAVDRKIEREFPDVSFISAAELQQQLDESGPAPLIIDVREDEEFRVSHLHNALNIQSGEAIASQLTDKNAEIVVYCSVGYRSAAVAAALADLGFTKVRNLRHSIFSWAEQGLPLRSASGPTNRVHPFNRAWGSLIDSRLHAFDAE